jgi:hypothetical protein
MQAAPLAAHLQPASLSGATNAARFRCPYLARPPISARPALRGKRAMDAIDSDDLYVVEQDASGDGLARVWVARSVRSAEVRAPCREGRDAIAAPDGIFRGFRWHSDESVFYHCTRHGAAVPGGDTPTVFQTVFQSCSGLNSFPTGGPSMPTAKGGDKPRKLTAIREPYNKSQLLAELTENTGLSRKDVSAVLEELSAVIERHLKKRGRSSPSARPPPARARA